MFRSHSPRKYYLFTVLVCTVFAYLALSWVFIYISAHTNYRCPSTFNTPSNWQLPDRYRNKESGTDKTIAQAKDWQLPHYQSVYFPSRAKNVYISGWYTEINKSAPTVIVVHGIRPNCKSVFESLLVSGMLAKGGLNVLNIDLQNYGDSSKTSRFIAYGQREYLDILGAFDWLVQSGYRPSQIGIAGLSLGAVTTAIAAASEEQIKAVWLDSPYADFNQMFCDELKASYLPCFFSHGVRWMAYTFLGVSPDTIKSTDVLTKNPNLYLFLTHGTKDKRIPIKHAYKFVEISKARDSKLETWIVDDNEHLEAMIKHPKTYQKKMVTFFRSRLKNDNKK